MALLRGVDPSFNSLGLEPTYTSPALLRVSSPSSSGEGAAPRAISSAAC